MNVRAKISAAKKGIPLSFQHREALKKPKSDQHKQNISKDRKASVTTKSYRKFQRWKSSRVP